MITMLEEFVSAVVTATVEQTEGEWHNTGGVWLPRVSSVVGMYPKPELYRWYGNHQSYESANAERDAAAERGTLVHTAAARLVRGETVDLAGWDARCVRLLQGFVNWWREKKPDLVASEVFLATDEYAGTADLVVWSGHELWLLDIKTSSGVYRSHFLQTAAYRHAWEYMGNPRIDHYGVLWLKSGTKKGYQVVKTTERGHTYEQDMAAYFHCLALFHDMHGYAPEVKEKEPLPERLALIEEAA